MTDCNRDESESDDDDDMYLFAIVSRIERKSVVKEKGIEKRYMRE